MSIRSSCWHFWWTAERANAWRSAPGNQMKEGMTMKAKIPVVCVVGFALGFWFYSIGRTMCETVDFDATAFGFGLLTGIGFPLFIILPFLVFKTIRSREGICPASWVIAFLA
jgi:hypothetical protein